MVSSLILVASLFACASAKRHWQMRRAEMVLHQYVTNIPPGFVDDGPANPESVLDLRIALVQNNKNGIIEALNNITTLGHPSYGQHLSRNETAQFLAPSPETVAAVDAWLQNAGLNATATTSIGDWLQLNTTVGKANDLLAANFSLFTNTETGQQSIRTLNYSIPINLVGHVDFVHPTTAFPIATSPQGTAAIMARAPNRNGFDANGCSADIVTPRCVQMLHGVPAATVQVGQPPARGVSIAVAGMNEQWANREDLATFLAYYRRDIVASHAQTFDFVTVKGGVNTQTLALAGDEADLNIQYTVGIAAGVPTTFYSIGTPDVPYGSSHEDLVNWFIDEDPNSLPGVLTVSYAGPERVFPQPLAERLCTAYATLGARGMSVIYASGDDGVGRVDPQTNQCPEGKFVPFFPASCPYVTAVGSTSITAAGQQRGAQFSGGGFSDLFSNNQLDWQLPAVQSYLRGLYPQYNNGVFKTTGRAYPDVSTIGSNVAYDWRGTSRKGTGPSASAPIFASMIGLINVARAEAGKGPLGWLNRFLYENPGAFVDIQQGSNPGCNTPGFPALPGWDPVTGLGTPNFNALKAAAVARP